MKTLTLNKMYDDKLHNGIFTKLASTKRITWLTDDVGSILDTDYYLGRSGYKSISVTYDNLLLVYDNDNDIALDKLSQIILLRYSNKWNRVFDELLEDNDFKDNINYVETRTPNLTKERTPNLSTENIQKTNTNMITNQESDNEDGIYGFNSETSIGDSTSNASTITTTKGDKEENVVENTRVETGLETINETGNEEKSYKGYNYTKDNLPSITSKILDLYYNNNLFRDIIYDDVDDVMTQGLYL